MWNSSNLILQTRQWEKLNRNFLWLKIYECPEISSSVAQWVWFSQTERLQLIMVFPHLCLLRCVKTSNRHDFILDWDKGSSFHHSWPFQRPLKWCVAFDGDLHKILWSNSNPRIPQRFVHFKILYIILKPNHKCIFYSNRK